MNKLQVMIPAGYEILRQSDESMSVYSFKRGDVAHERWYSWKLGAIDAMWIDVRDRATRAARPDTQKEQEAERQSMQYAMGYVDSKFHTMEAVEQALARSGYVLKVKEPVAVVEHLLQLLSGQ
jgi:hypothetical protein